MKVNYFLRPLLGTTVGKEVVYYYLFFYFFMSVPTWIWDRYEGARDGEALWLTCVSAVSGNLNYSWYMQCMYGFLWDSFLYM